MSRGSRRWVQTRRVQGASAASASSASAPVRFRARATATSNEKRAWRGEHAGPAPTGANPGRGRGLDGTKYAQSSLPSKRLPAWTRAGVAAAVAPGWAPRVVPTAWCSQQCPGPSCWK